MKSPTLQATSSFERWHSLRSLFAHSMHPRFLPQLVLVGLLAALVWVGLLQLTTPEVVPASAPANVFSADRAIDHLDVIAAEPRPIGSPGHLATREYLLNQIRALGLVPEIQTTSVIAGSEGGDGFGAGTITNIITRITGTNSTGAIAINAHYDGGNTGPAASDNGSGVVVALETLRAVVAGDPLQNDLIVVFSDGEENGMLGAAAFNEQHPWAKDVQLAINFEAQGSGGPALLYATSDESGWLVQEFLSVVPDASAYSILPEISRLLPDARLDCDLGEYTEEGSHGFGFVYAGDTPAYHTALDTIDRIEVGSVQQEGGYTLALVRHFGEMDLGDMARTPNRVYFTILPGVVVNYAFTWAVPLATLVTMLVGGIVAFGLRRQMLTVKGLVGGTAAFLLSMVVTVAITWAIWFAIRTLNANYQVMLVGNYQTALYVVALTLASIAILTSIYAVLRRKVLPQNLSAGVLIGGTAVLWFTSITVPGISYVVAWPLLFGLLPLGWSVLFPKQGERAWPRIGVLFLAAIPAIVLVPGTLYQIIALVNRFEGLTGFPLLGLTMLFVAPLIPLLLPHFHLFEEALGGRRWPIPAVASILAIALIGWGNMDSGFDAERPRPNQIAYQLDADRSEARWVSYDQNLDSWTAQFFPDDVQRSDPGSMLYAGRSGFVAPAPPADLEGAEIEVISDTTSAGLRTLSLNLSGPADVADFMLVRVSAQGPIVEASINGQALDVDGNQSALDGVLTAAYANVPDEGWVLSLTISSERPITLQVEHVVDGLPELEGIDARPAEMMPAPGILDPTIVKNTYTL